MEELLTVKQAAAELQAGIGFIYECCDAGLLEHVRLGTRSIRIPRAALEAFIEKGRKKVCERNVALLMGCKAESLVPFRSGVQLAHRGRLGGVRC